jgi:DnaJ-class molecular chaperone
VIERAFGELTRLHGPRGATLDTTEEEEEPRDAALYRKIVAAYDVLRDPFARALHDCCGANAVTSAENIK